MELPTRTVVKNSQVHVSEIPLPAVTVCTESDETVMMFAQGFVDDIMIPKKYSRELVMDAIARNNIEMARYTVRSTANLTHLALLDHLLEVNRMSVRQYVERLMPPCDKLFKKCRLRGTEYPCGQLFQRTHGRCCSFNVPRDGYTFKPEYPISAGLAGGLSLVVTGEYGAPRLVSHQSLFYPDLDQRTINVTFGQQIALGFESFQMEAMDEIKQLQEHVRDCVFNDERSLRFFSEYTYFNCQIETRMNISLALCDCIGYYYPAPDHLVCNWTQMACVRENSFINRRFVIGALPQTTKKVADDIRRKIQAFDGRNCVMDCGYRDYRTIDVHAVNLHSLESDFTGFYSGMDVANHGVVHLYFPSPHYVLQEMLLVTDWVTWLCSLGGVFGLLLGCSFITVAEIAYFIWTRIVSVDLYRKLLAIKRKFTRSRKPRGDDFKIIQMTILGPTLIKANNVFYINDELLKKLENSGELYVKKPSMY